MVCGFGLDFLDCLWFGKTFCGALGFLLWFWSHGLTFSACFFGAFIALKMTTASIRF